MRVLDALACDVLVVKPGNFRNRIPKKGRAAPYGMANPGGYPMFLF
jgi:hypothetical protein